MTNAPAPPRAHEIRATVLFADIVGFDQLSAASGTETAYSSVTHLLRLLDGIARRHGGSVDKYQGDKLMALFGHPQPLARPSLAAALAALEMRHRVADYDREAQLETPLDIHIGINAGTFVSGEVRGPVVREYHVLGDAVNVAARINSSTPSGEIWVGESVRDAIADSLGMRALPPLELKGKSRPVPVFALDANPGPVLRHDLATSEAPASALVGRSDEMAVLLAKLGALAAGTGGALRLVGPEGSGRSRLIAELGKAPEIEAVEVLHLAGRSLDRERPFALISPLLGEARGDGSASPDPEAVARELGDELFARAKTRPVLLVIENVEQVDAASLRVLDGLRALTRQAPLLVLTTSRAGNAGTPDTSREDEATLELAPLGAAEARALALAVLGDAADDETVRLVLERADAQPGSVLRAAFLAPVLRSESEQAADREDRSSEAERRRCAVVFADLTGFTAMSERVGAERAYPVVTSCLEILDEVARSHGGSVDHYLGDCVMALFGVPRAIEDAPRAAVNAAIEMRERIRHFARQQDLPVPLDVHTGVAMGLGIAGDISGPVIRDFAVMGDHVDRADALCHLAAAGEIRVDAATERATRDVFRFQAAAPGVLPGDTRPQPSYDLFSDAPQLHRAQLGAGRQVFSTLVGRDEELGVIRRALADLAEGRGGIVQLSAEAGIGKSRLLNETSASPEAERCTWLVGRALSNGRNVGYHPIADLLRTWARIGDADDDASARRKLDELVAAHLPQAADEAGPLLANLMGLALGPEERQRLDAIQGDAADKVVRAAFVRLLRGAASQGPVAIVMEDLHWADLSTIDLLESILGLCAEQPILFVHAFRPGFEDTSGRLLQTGRDRYADRTLEISLAPLDSQAARTLVKNLFRGGDVPQQTRAAIEERARGNPFYIEEVVRTLVDLGAVEVHEDGFRATGKLESFQIPDTVQEAVMARVDRLDLPRRSLLQAASVIGGTFHLEVLEDVLASARLAPLLESLEQGEFIAPSDRTAGVEYAFKHPLIQEVVYDSLLEARREELHLTVARATEKRLAEASPGYFAMLAFHFSKGRDLDRAEAFLFRAGDEASRVAASNEALFFFQQASALYDELHGGRGDPGKRARLEKSVAVALMNRGRLIEAVQHFDTAATLLGHTSPRGTVRMGLHLARNLGSVLARLYLGRLDRDTPASETDRELIDIMFRRAMAQSTTDATQFFADCTELLRLLSRFDPASVSEAAAIYSGLTAIFSFGGISFDVSRRLLDRAHALARAGAIDERFLYYRVLNFLHHLLAGDWSDEHAVPAELVAEGIREGRFWEASTYLDLDCHRQLYQGHFDAAWERVEGLAEIVDLYQNELASSARLAHTAFVHLERREFDEALAHLDVYFDEHSEVLFNIVALGTRGRVEALRGQLERAEETIARAEGLIREGGRVPPFHASYVHSARHLVDLLRVERRLAAGVRPTRGELRGLAKSRRRSLRTAAWVPWRRTEALRLAGREDWLRGRRAKAVAWWERAIDCGRRLDAGPELARSWEDAGRALSETPGELTLLGRDGPACLREADALFAALGLPSEREALARVA